MKKYRKHIFVCTNEREPGHVRGCCYEKGSLEVLDRFKSKVKELGLKMEVRAQRAGCLNFCENGITVVVYPEAIWYKGVKVEDVDEIVNSHIVNDTPVARLLLFKE